MSMGTNPSEQPTNLLFANFNQDNTSLAAGSKSGYRLFSLSSVEKLDPIYENGTEDAYIVERLFASSLVAIVSQQHPRKLKVCHFKKGTEICNYSYAGSILSCKLNRQRLVVCLEESLYIHNIRDMKVLHNIRDTPINPTGLIALSICDENSFLAFPNSNQTGEVQIFDTINLRGVIMIPAHDNRLAALAFSPKGDKIATASEKGTVIRVFGLPDGAKLFEFRRGVKRCVSITCLSFSQDATFLCSSSNTETVHVFKLEQPREKQAEESGSWMGMFGAVVKSSASVLPAQMTDMFSQGRSFATAHLPCTGTKNTCAITTIQKLPRLLVVNLEGAMFIYNLDPNESGECQLVRQHRLDGANPEGSQGDQASADRPLTHPSTGGSPGATNTYASSARRLDGGAQAAGSSGKPAACDWSPGESYADVLRRRGGPQEKEPSELMDLLLDSPAPYN
ncbi:WD repeat domain phosphoinositide-interacting protein 2-like isoform X1 [Babylonia areolata]|uniref:WD repeat domain phosphoinositide-interacting protein 2-like isoform X1 n=1 Tax=Babylonia areolata TaxID=304850 RepID=UPI003FD6B27E